MQVLRSDRAVLKVPCNIVTEYGSTHFKFGKFYDFNFCIFGPDLACWTIEDLLEQWGSKSESGVSKFNSGWYQNFSTSHEGICSAVATKDNID